MHRLVGCRVLVVEDDALLAMDLEQILSQAGSVVLGPCCTVDDALARAAEEMPDVAILDMNLRGVMVFPVADLLADAGVPFIVVSGHTRGVLPARHRGRPFLTKPFDAARLTALLRELLAAQPARSSDPRRRRTGSPDAPRSRRRRTPGRLQLIP
jgi:DNA-binding response OmpR family regulator